MRRIIGLITIIIGLIVILSPTVLNEITDIQMEEKIKDFIVISNNVESKDELFEKLKKYNELLYKNGQKIVDAFSYEDVSINLKEYGYDENIIGYLTIEKLDLKLPIYLGATEANLYKGATHLSQTSIPIGGENTNAVIAAHRGLIRNKMFRHLDKLEKGDIVTITNMWDTLNYEVIEKEVIHPTNISEILIRENKDLVTLITCHPYRVNTHRYIVVCERIK